MSHKKIIFDLETSGLNAGESVIFIGEKKGNVIHFYDKDISKAITEHGQKLVRELMTKCNEYDNRTGSSNK